MVGSTDVARSPPDPATGERPGFGAGDQPGDFCADAYRAVMGADIAFVNGASSARMPPPLTKAISAPITAR